MTASLTFDNLSLLTFDCCLIPMRSQKQNNKPPRPFKNQSGAGRWSGAQGGGFIPPPKFPQPKKKSDEPDDLPGASKAG